MSGYSTLVISMWLARDANRHLHNAISRLSNGGTLPLDQVNVLYGYFRTQGDRISDYFGPIWGVLMTLFVMHVYSTGSFVADFWYYAFIAVFGTLSFFTGRYIGRMTCYGVILTFSSFNLLTPKDAKLTPYAAHPDGCSGLRPLGELLLYFAKLPFVPIIFFALWSLLIPVLSKYHLVHWYYNYWRDMYIALLLFSVFLEGIVFALPVAALHCYLSKLKASKRDEMDELGHKVVKFQRILHTLPVSQISSTDRDKLNEMSGQYWVLQHMPIWPFDAVSWVKLAVATFSLASTVVVTVGKDATLWTHLIDASPRVGTQGQSFHLDLDPGPIPCSGDCTMNTVNTSKLSATAPLTATPAGFGTTEHILATARIRVVL